MQPLQDDLRDPAAKDITHTAKARSNLDAAIPMRSAETELQNTRKLRATASEIVAPKSDLDARAKKNDFEALFKRILKKKNFYRENFENLLANHYRSLDAATPIRFTMFSCKRRYYYACSRGID